jgi:hypothetical protein
MTCSWPGAHTCEQMPVREAQTVRLTFLSNVMNEATDPQRLGSSSMGGGTNTGSDSMLQPRLHTGLTRIAPAESHAASNAPLSRSIEAMALAPLLPVATLGPVHAHATGRLGKWGMLLSDSLNLLMAALQLHRIDPAA